MRTPEFGISTLLFLDSRLDREHLVEVAAHGFEAVELFAARTHFDYHDLAAIDRLAEWLDDTRLTLHSVHAPIAAGYRAGAWGEAWSTATSDDAKRRVAVQECRAALGIATRLPFRHLVLHLGVPSEYAGAGDNQREPARRSVEELHDAAQQAGVMLALEIIPNALSSADALVSLIEDVLELPGVGICVDTGHARLQGDVVDAVETCSGHVLTTHVHDNTGRADDHRLPFEGDIDWPAVALAFQKVGYDDRWIFELPAASDAPTVLSRAARVRRRLEESLGLADELLQ